MESGYLFNFTDQYNIHQTFQTNCPVDVYTTRDETFRSFFLEMMNIMKVNLISYQFMAKFQPFRSKVVSIQQHGSCLMLKLQLICHQKCEFGLLVLYQLSFWCHNSYQEGSNSLKYIYPITSFYYPIKDLFSL